jgi:hypothetical protein
MPLLERSDEDGQSCTTFYTYVSIGSTYMTVCIYTLQPIRVTAYTGTQLLC